MNRWMIFVLIFSGFVVHESSPAVALCERGGDGSYHGHLPPLEGEEISLDFAVDCSAGVQIRAEVQGRPLHLIESKNNQLRYRDSNGRMWLFKLEEARVGRIVFGRVVVTVVRGNKTLLRSQLANGVFADQKKPSCRSVHGDGGFWDGHLKVTFSPNDVRNLAGLAQVRDWLAIDLNDDTISGDALFFSPRTCSNHRCKIDLDVGPGVEFAAISEINSLGPNVCARWVGAEAGSPPITISGIPLATFTNPEAPSPSRSAKLVNERLLARIFPQRVEMTELRVIGRGHTYGFSAVGPAPAIGLRRGYWYKADISLTIGVNVYSPGVTETVTLTVLDLIEIRAPESLKRLPQGLIRSGRKMDYIDPKTGQLGRDGTVMRAWLETVATRIAGAFGGQVIGGG